MNALNSNHENDTDRPGGLPVGGARHLPTPPVVTIDLHTVLPWSEGKIIQTVRGPKLLRTSPPTPEFWDIWRANKQTLVASGINPGKHYQTGEWEIKWWSEPPADYMETYNRNLSGSRAVDAQIDIPCPPGCELMPFQRAGVAFLLGSLK